MWPFEFHPVDPDGGRHSVAVLLLGCIKGFPERFHVAVVRLFFLHGELAGCVRTHFEGNLNDLRLFDGSRNLVCTDRSTLQTVVEFDSGVRSLRVPDINEMARRIGTLHCSDSHAKGVVPERQFFRGHDHASGSFGRFQVSARVAMRQPRIVLEIFITGWSVGVGGIGIRGIIETELLCIRDALESISKTVETKWV